MTTAALEPLAEDLTVILDDLNQAALHDERTRLKGNLYEFLQSAWPLVEQEMAFVPVKHVKILCDLLQDITVKSNMPQRWVFNIPPGTLKSLLINVIWPAWIWARNGRKKFFTASYGAHLTTRDNLRCRQIVESQWYQRLFPLRLADDQNAKTRYNTDQGGWRVASSVDGVGTGEHPDFFIIDDPLTATMADSEVERNRVVNWFKNTVSTRGKVRRVTVILVMQRLHRDDLSGYLLAQGDVEHVHFPMRYEPTRPKSDEDPGYQADPRDWRTVPGELLCPELFTEKMVKELEKDLGAYGTAGQLQQQPAPEGGGLFKRTWFKYLPARPKKVLRSARGWDTAASEKKGDYTAGVRIDEFEDGLFAVINVKRDQLSPAGVDALMLATAAEDGVKTVQREEKEGGASGLAVVESRTKMLVGYDHKGVQVSTSKILRSKPFRSQCEAGNVYLVRTGNLDVDSWIEPYLAELCEFPTGSHDDQVDGSSAGFNAVLLEPKPKKLKSSSW